MQEISIHWYIKQSPFPAKLSVKGISRHPGGPAISEGGDLDVHIHRLGKIWAQSDQKSPDLLRLSDVKKIIKAILADCLWPSFHRRCLKKDEQMIRNDHTAQLDNEWMKGKA